MALCLGNRTIELRVCCFGGWMSKVKLSNKLLLRQGVFMYFKGGEGRAKSRSPRKRRAGNATLYRSNHQIPLFPLMASSLPEVDIVSNAPNNYL
jgi:hypothetical protein